MKYVNWRLAALAGVGGALLLYAILSMLTVYSSACTYVMTDGERYETVKLYPGSIEEACEKAGFQNVEVVSQKEDDGTVYLTLKESFDVSIQTSAQTLTVRTAPCTVGELLEQNGRCTTVKKLRVRSWRKRKSRNRSTVWLSRASENR